MNRVHAIGCPALRAADFLCECPPDRPVKVTHSTRRDLYSRINATAWLLEDTDPLRIAILAVMEKDQGY